VAAIAVLFTAAGALAPALRPAPPPELQVKPSLPLKLPVQSAVGEEDPKTEAEPDWKIDTIIGHLSRPRLSPPLKIYDTL